MHPEVAELMSRLKGQERGAFVRALHVQAAREIADERVERSERPAGAVLRPTEEKHEVKELATDAGLLFIDGRVGTRGDFERMRQLWS